MKTAMAKTSLMALTTTLWFGAAASDWSSSLDGAARRCEPVSIAMCRGVGYNETAMPNQFNHATQDEAGLIVHQFWPLVEISCSPYLRFFLCSMYVPICLRDFGRPLPPCRSVCEHARRGCEPLMRNYGFKWPDDLDCARLPESGKDDPDHLCMEPPAISAELTTSSTTSTTASSAAPSTPAGSLFVPDRPDGGVWRMHQEHPRPHGGDALVSCRCECRTPFVIAPERPGARVARNLTHCAQPCRSPYVEPDRLELARLLLTLWAVCCLVASLLTCLTFLVDMDRFHYPERPIFCLTFCYMLVSAGYLLRYVAGHSAVACDGNMARGGASQVDLCLAVFVLTYYFGMASAVWWVILSLTWFLAAGLKWSHEAIASYWPYFHLAAWLPPLAQLAVALGAHAVDGDPATGLCGVGNTDVDMLRALELGPLVAYVVLGSAFLAAGFASLVRIRHIVKAQTMHQQQLHQQYKQPLCTPYHQHVSPGAGSELAGCVSPVGRLEQLMLKLGGFALLYALPTAVRIVALFYEQHFRTSWEISLACHCSVSGFGTQFAGDQAIMFVPFINTLKNSQDSNQ